MCTFWSFVLGETGQLANNKALRDDVADTRLDSGLPLRRNLRGNLVNFARRSSQRRQDLSVSHSFTFRGFFSCISGKIQKDAN